MYTFFRENGMFVASTLLLIVLIASANGLGQKEDLDYIYQPHSDAVVPVENSQSTNITAVSVSRATVVSIPAQTTSPASSTAMKRSIRATQPVTTTKPAVQYRVTGEEGGDDN